MLLIFHCCLENCLGQHVHVVFPFPAAFHRGKRKQGQCLPAFRDENLCFPFPSPSVPLWLARA